MEQEKKQIELRSEKVRNIVGQVPPVLLRYGISIIGLAICILLAISAIIPYQPTVDAELEVWQDNADELHYVVNIAKSKMKDVELYSSVRCERASELELPSVFNICEVSDTLQLADHGAWYKAVVTPESLATFSVKLQDSPIIFPAKIVLKRRSLMMWVLTK